jgi:mycothiol synthase
MTTQTQFQARPFAGEADFQGICDLINTCNQVDHLTDEPYASLAFIREWLMEDPDLDRERDLRLWADSTGRIIGIGVTRIAPANADDPEPVVDGHLFLRVHPDARNEGLEAEIVQWAGDRVRAVGQERGQPAHLRAGLHKTTPEYVAYRKGVLEGLGFRPVRYGYKMARPLNEPLPDAVLPAGYTQRTVAAEEQAQWVDLFNWSFIDHWNHHPLSEERNAHWISGPNYRADGDLLAVAPDGTFAAFCRCEINTEDNAANGRNEGWIEALGTRRGHRQRGLGRAMLLAGMRWLKAQGVDTAVLGVDAENPTGALRLYESVGFTVANTTYTYHKDLT